MELYYAATSVSGLKITTFSIRICIAQGSVLGPLLYSLYTTPLHSIISIYPGIRCHFYTDDIQILRLLGVTISNDLKWSAHAALMQRSINRMVGTINRFGCSLNVNTRQRIVNAFVLPKLTYALPVWCWVNKGSEDNLNHCILRCARVILRKKDITLNSSTHAATGLLPFNTLSSVRCNIRTHKLLASDESDAYLPPLLTATESDRVTRNTSGRKFAIPAVSIKSFSTCFYCSAAKCWNELPHTITEKTCFSSFNNHMQNYLLNKL